MYYKYVFMLQHFSHVKHFNLSIEVRLFKLHFQQRTKVPSQKFMKYR